MQTGGTVLDEAAIVTFDAAGAGTRVRYEHIGIPDDSVSASEHGKAIEATLSDLADMIGG